jgi:cation transport regulator
MPYRTNADLPLPLRTHLPPRAQDIYREAFNHAYAAHSDDPRREQMSHRIAWGAVKRSYVVNRRANLTQHRRPILTLLSDESGR